MKSFHFTLLTILVIILCVNLNNGECLNNQNKCSTNRSNLSALHAFLLVTSDTLWLIYPKELGYSEDIKELIFKINVNSTNDNKKIQIKDAVYDSHTNSIYCSILCQHCETELIRLSNYKSDQSNKEETILQNNYQIATNWSITLVIKNYYSQIISLDINIKKRKLYWLELSNEGLWSFVFKNLNNTLSLPKYYTFNNYFFSNNSYISVAHDNHINKTHNNNDIVFFASNKQVLSICYLVNTICYDYFPKGYHFFFADSIIDVDDNNKVFFNDNYLAYIHSLKELDRNRIDRHFYEFNDLRGIFYDQKSFIYLILVILWLKE